MKNSTAGDNQLPMTAIQNTEPAPQGAGSAVWCSRVLYGIRMLPKCVRDRVLEQESQLLSEHLEGSLITLSLKNYAASKHGLTGVEIYWSLSSCQGDGVAFEGCPDIQELKKKDPKLSRLLRALKARDIEFLFEIKHKSRYTHSNSMDYYVELSGSYRLTTREEKVADWLENYLKEKIQSISGDLERYGYAAIEDETSLSRALNSFVENGQLFTIEGELEDDADLSLLCDACSRNT